MQPTPSNGEQRSWAKATGFLIALYLVGLAMIAGIVLVAGGKGGGSDSGGGAATTIAVKLTEFKIDGQLMAPPGAVTLEVTNDGTMQHDLTIADLGKTTGMIQPGYFDRKYTGYPNGHASVGSMSIKYDAYEGSQARGVGWPGLAPGGWTQMAILRGKKWKYVHFAALPPLLFDLENDPDEMNDLSKDPAHAGIMLEMAQKMLSWRLRHQEHVLTDLHNSPRGVEDWGKRQRG